jgi:RNA polymerase sigma factor (sigma-70 family)
MRQCLASKGSAVRRCANQTTRAVHLMSASAFSSLTARQREIVILVANALSNKEIARRLGLSEGTVKVHLHSIYRQLGIRNRTALAGLVHTPRPG